MEIWWWLSNESGLNGGGGEQKDQEWLMEEISDRGLEAKRI